MKTRFYTLIINLAQTFKCFLGIKNFSAFKKKIKRFFLSSIYKKKYTEDDIIGIMKSMGLTKGVSVFIHSSMTEFYNFEGSAEALINRILEEIGPEGTLSMPAYPNHSLLREDSEGVLFDVLKTKSGAGYMTEVFRKMPGVKRSINKQHSVCSIGKMAEYYISEHHLSLTAWDKFSPYYKLTQTDALVFSFGLSSFLGTLIHCTESLCMNEYKYFDLFFRKKEVYKYRDEFGNIGTHVQYTNDFARRTNKKRIVKKYVDKNELHVQYISNLRIQMIKANYIHGLFMDLARKGITMYTIPSPKPYRNSDGTFIKLS